MRLFGSHAAQQDRELRGYRWFWNGVPVSTVATFQDFSWHAPYSIIGLRLRGANDAGILPGVKGFYPVPFDCTISYWTLMADQVGSVVFDIYKTAFAAAPPGPDDTIITLSAERPALVGSRLNLDRRLAGWNIQLFRGDILAIDVLSADRVSSVTLSLFVTRNDQP